jgi:hypothetical protein
VDTDGLLRITRSCAVASDELEWRFTASGGPLLERLGPVVRVTASERRSQHQNRELALERLGAKLASALHVDPARHSTKPSRAAKQRRVDEKRRHGDVKRTRRRPPVEE